MAPPPSSLYTLPLFLAVITTLLVTACLRLLAILPNASQPRIPKKRKRPLATRVLIVLGSGGHTHEMFDLLRDLDTRTYTHRTYVVSSGDVFSARRAVEFERVLEEREERRWKGSFANGNGHGAESGKWTGHGTEEVRIKITTADGITATRQGSDREPPRPPCVGPAYYNIALIPRARKVHQSLLTTPFTSLYTLYASFAPLLHVTPSPSPILSSISSTAPLSDAAASLPSLILTNGPATGVIVILASLLLRFFNIRGAESRGTCRSIYIESFARVKTLSLSGKILLRLVDRFLVQWEELEGRGGRAEFWGVLV